MLMLFALIKYQDKHGWIRTFRLLRKARNRRWAKDFERHAKGASMSCSLHRMKMMALAFFMVASAAFSGETVTVTRVIDGDTIRVWDGAKDFPVRLIGVDCPEIRINEKAERDAAEWGVELDEITKAGLSAKNFAAARIGVTVALETDGLDDYGRTLAYVFLADGRCLNEILIQNGAALARYRHRDNDRYAELETAARRERRGFWPNLWRSRGEN